MSAPGLTLALDALEQASHHSFFRMADAVQQPLVTAGSDSGSFLFCCSREYCLNVSTEHNQGFDYELQEQFRNHFSFLYYCQKKHCLSTSQHHDFNNYSVSLQVRTVLIDKH